jgi:hypothetical protein
VKVVQPAVQLVSCALYVARCNVLFSEPFLVDKKGFEAAFKATFTRVTIFLNTQGTRKDGTNPLTYMADVVQSVLFKVATGECYQTGMGNDSLQRLDARWSMNVEKPDDYDFVPNVYSEKRNKYFREWGPKTDWPLYPGSGSSKPAGGFDHGDRMEMVLGILMLYAPVAIGRAALIELVEEVAKGYWNSSWTWIDVHEWEIRERDVPVSEWAAAVDTARDREVKKSAGAVTREERQRVKRRKY